MSAPGRHLSALVRTVSFHEPKASMIQVSLCRKTRAAQHYSAIALPPAPTELAGTQGENRKH